MQKKSLIFVFHLIVNLLASLVTALAFNYLIIPNNILSGGLTGITIVINYFTGWGVGLLYFLFNIPIFIWAYKELGKRFIVYSGIAVLVLSVFIDYLPLKPYFVTQDPMLASIYGGIMLGLGVVLWLRIGGSGGGMDIVAVLLNKRYGLSVGQVSLVLNGIVILMSTFIYSVEQTMYTLITIFVSSKVIDGLQSVQSKKTVMIISPQSRVITDQIWSKLNRGVTYLDGSGAYTNQETKIIMCVMTRFEIAELKRLVFQIDPDAFITINTTDEVLGHFRKGKASTSI
ncbi:YitT family protein [Ammoniphilus sp. CFH 90114]|uniref:YitT family protein n=1 Tax=Ammoniphilus sp. CFH 90114 TaxID=2493665 RepID=UPI00100F4506|nr:YitT family protein [Ammoniphilus sp. CFH 90114]RXT06341.1 YitT family protein [Ammoniphilus sp. CFH 90114]